MSLTGNDTLTRSKMQTLPDASGFGQGWSIFLWIGSLQYGLCHFLIDSSFVTVCDASSRPKFSGVQHDESRIIEHPVS